MFALATHLKRITHIHDIDLKKNDPSQIDSKYKNIYRC